MKSKKIKTCFISPFAYGLFNPEASLKFGGAEVQMYLISTELARDNDFEVSFVVLDVGQEKTEKKEGVKLYKAYERGRNFLNLIIAPLKLFFTLMKINPDVVACQAVGVETGIGVFYAKLFGKKSIYNIAHDKDLDGSYFHGLRGKIFKFGLENADFTIAQKQSQLEKFQAKYPGKKTMIVKNSLRINENFAKIEKKFVLWVGSSLAIKRPEVFIDLVKKFPNEKFTMIMTKSSAGLEEFDKIKKEAEKIQNLELIEHVPYNKIDEYYRDAKIFVITSAGEGVPNVVLQAANFKAPILSSEVDPDNFIKKYDCGFVCGNNLVNLKNKLEELLKNNEERMIKGENAYQYVKKEYNIVDNTNKWKEIIKKRYEK